MMKQCHMHLTQYGVPFNDGWTASVDVHVGELMQCPEPRSWCSEFSHVMEHYSVSYDTEMDIANIPLLDRLVEGIMVGIDNLDVPRMITCIRYYLSQP